MNKQRILFLDIDGVLNMSEGYPGGFITPHLHADKVHRLNAIITSTLASVVLLTNWRFPHMLGVEGTQKALVNGGLVADFAGSCPGPYPCRGMEVDAWRSQNEHSGAYVVIDDRTDYHREHWSVHPVAERGLTDREAQLAILFLTRDVHG